MQFILKNPIIKMCLLLFILCFAGSCLNTSNSNIHVLLITGGHSYDTTAFLDLFRENNPGFQFDTISQPVANRFIGSGKADPYDVLVFYDSWQNITDTELNGYFNLAETGKGFLFLHHSLASYQDKPEFFKLRGGGYYRSEPPDSLKDMRYKHDLDIPVEIQDINHPVTKGMVNFTIHDEGYNNIIVNDDVVPLLKTSHPDCAEIMGWTKRYRNSKVVYLMGGHDKIAYENANFKVLIHNSLNYLSNKK